MSLLCPNTPTLTGPINTGSDGNYLFPRTLQSRTYLTNEGT